MKEELKAGRTLRQAIDLGWRRAWPSIRDSNISTLITCLILFMFGSTFGASIVKGFAADPGAGRVGQPVYRHHRHPHLPAHCDG